MLNFKNIALRRGARFCLLTLLLRYTKDKKVGFTARMARVNPAYSRWLKMNFSWMKASYDAAQSGNRACFSGKCQPLTARRLIYIVDGDAELRRLQQQLVIAEQKDDGLKQAELHTALELSVVIRRKPAPLGS